MTMPVNDKILYTDFNSIQSAIANILGTGSGSFGYGQRVRSSAVSGASGSGGVLGGGSGADRITVDQYSRLRSDIITIYRKIYGTDPTPADPAIGQLIRWVTLAGATTSEYNISEYNIAEYNATSIGGSSDPYTQFSVFVTDLQSNRFTTAVSQLTTLVKGTAVRTNAWGGGNASVSVRISCSFSSSNAARAFFNTGGTIRFTSSKTTAAVNAQNTAWTNLLNGIGTKEFGAQLPSTTLTGTSGQNWYTLTNTYQNWYSVTDSAPYGANNYIIQARTLNGAVLNNNTGSSQGVDFIVKFTDNYIDPDTLANPGSNPASNPPGDSVDGTLSVAVAITKCVTVLYPEEGSNFYAIEEPTITLTGVSTGTANTID
jgi:hypothetical protein